MRRVALTTLIVASLAASACGGNEAEAPPRPLEVVAVTTTRPPPFDETDIRFAEEFWHSGFRVELNRAEVWTSTARFTNRTSYWLTLWGDFENLGAEVASFEPEMAIVAGGVEYANRTGDPPRLLPGTTALGELTFQIPEDLDMEAAEFVIGGADENQARIQLDGSGPAARLEPTELVVAAQTTTDLIDIAVTGGLLSYDVPAQHQQLEAGQRAVTLQFDVTSRAESKGEITAEDLTLTMPDGSTVAPAAFADVTVPGESEAVMTADLSVTFVVADDVAGDYVLRLGLHEAFVAVEGPTEAMLELNL